MPWKERKLLIQLSTNKNGVMLGFLTNEKIRIPHCGVQEAHQILQQLTVCAQRPSNRIKAVHYLPLQINSNN